MRNFFKPSENRTGTSNLSDKQKEVVDRIKQSLKTIETHGTNKKTLGKINEAFSSDEMKKIEDVKAYIDASNLKGDVSENDLKRYYGNVNKALNGSSDEDNNPYYESIEEYPEWVENSEKFFTKVAIGIGNIRAFFKKITPPKSPKVKRAVLDTEDTVQKTMEAELKEETESYIKSTDGGYIKLAK